MDFFFNKKAFLFFNVLLNLCMLLAYFTCIAFCICFFKPGQQLCAITDNDF